MQSLWQCCKDIPARNSSNIIEEFTEGNTTDSFKFKAKITVKTRNKGTKNVEIMVPLKYLSNFWRTLEMPQINCEVNLILTWSSTCVLVSTNINNQNERFTITDIKLYVPVVSELLAQNPDLNHLAEPSFQGVHRLFVLAFENDDDRTSDEKYYFPTAEIKGYNIMINGENLFDQPIKNRGVTYDNIRKISTSQGDDYTTGCLLDYPYFTDT